ncbi:MAG: hypothetical protein KC417_08650 [Myxococcales bacterium]|nr:hypothetical protein [Myxococcales bacterium]
MKLFKISMIAGLALALAACGGDDKKSSAKPGTVNEATAKSTATTTVQTATTLTTSTDANQGMTAANQFMGVAQAQSSIITPDFSGGTTAGTCSCEGTSCTFQDCGDENGSFTMSGSLDWTGGHIVGDLEYNINSAGSGVSAVYNITLSIDLTVTETSVDGTLSTHGSYSIDLMGQGGADTSGAYSWSSSVDYMNVMYSGAGGSPTGGSLHVEAMYTIAGIDYAGEADVSFP